MIVLDKRTGRLVAADGTRIADHLLHGQWSSLSMGRVGGRKLLFFGGGDGCCYAFEALASVPERPVRLKTVWWYDCIPPEYKAAAGDNRIAHYCLGDRRVKGTLNHNDGKFVGMSEIVGTPVLVGTASMSRSDATRARSRAGGLALRGRDGNGEHHAVGPGVALPGAGPNALDGVRGQWPGLSLQRGGPTALSRCGDGQMLLDKRDPIADLGLKPWLLTGKCTCRRQSTSGY